MSKENMKLAYRKRVDSHLVKSFEAKSPPAMLNVMSAEWIASVKSAVPPSTDVLDAAPEIIADAIRDWLVGCGYEVVGTTWCHVERHSADITAAADAKRKKAAADSAPLRALIREAVSEALAEAGVGGVAGGVETDLRKVIGGGV